ncbi:MAG: hypothetical protein J6A59_09805 [Lachnospiraceae bacterium]|nr:hypothetical protein [Lachnospiraceae bacterium]
MNFGVIVAKKVNNIYVLAEGDYTELQGLYEIYQNSAKDMQVVLIPFDKDEFDNIKGQTELLIEEFRGYFKNEDT